jgi:nicotinamidase-related amidase
MSDDARRALLLLHLQNEVVDPGGYIGRRGIGAVVAERGVIAAAGRARRDFDQAGEPVLHVVFERPAAAGDPGSGAAGPGAAGSEVVWSTAPQLREPPAGAFSPGGWGVRPHPDLLRPGDETVVHHTMSAFAGTGLQAWLAGRGITRVVLGGVSTHLVVVATAFAASDAGLDVEVLAAACASPTAELQEAGLVICQSLGRVTR